MLEAEWAFTKSVEDICTVVEEMMKESYKGVQEEIDLDNNLLKVQSPWTRISYKEAVSELEKQDSLPQNSSKFSYKPAWGRPLQSEHEKWLAQVAGGPVFVTDYPKVLKPFYMRLNDDQETVACFDLLVPGIGELVGGSLREERLPQLDNAMSQHGLNLEDYEWYRDLRRFGGAPHGGFGLGFERFVSFLTGIENVRECIPMPRWAGRMLL
jgi:asparaginyl-tRNA synthetase